MDCGACEPVCPTEAIFYESDLPSVVRLHLRANVGFFMSLGSPGGAQKTGVQDFDDPMIRRAAASE